MAIVWLVVIAVGALILALSIDRLHEPKTPERLRMCAVVLIMPLSIPAALVSVGNLIIPVNSTSVFCPLLAILVVLYCLYGPRAARRALLVCMSVRIVLMLFRVAFTLVAHSSQQGVELPGLLPALAESSAPSAPAIRGSIASAACLGIDFVLAAAAFQLVARNRKVPLGVAAAFALIGAQLLDAVLYPLFLHGKIDVFLGWLQAHLVATAPMLILGPMIGLYVEAVLHPAAIRRLREGKPFDLLQPPPDEVEHELKDPTPIVVADEDGRIVHASDGLRALLGLRDGEEPRTLQELASASLEQPFVPGADTQATLRTRLGTRRVHLFTTSMKLGNRALASTLVQPVDDPIAPPGLRSLAMAGYAVSGVAHDMANLVQALAPLVEIASMKADENVRVMLGDVVSRITMLTKCLRDLGRPSERVRESIELSSFTRRVLAPFSEKLPGGTKLAIDVGESTSAFADPVELDRILVNLVLAAARSSRGGEVEVHIAREESIARLSVHERTSSMPDLPQFVRGDGLDLAVVAASTREMGGRLSIHSRAGEGTTVEIELPLAAAS